MEDGLAGEQPQALEHTALRKGSDHEHVVPLYQERLTDGHRVGVLLQVASVLAHAQLRQKTIASLTTADSAGELLGEAWLDRRKLLGGLELAEGSSSSRTQQVLRRLTLDLFEADAEVAGRGQARRAVRRLLSGWEDKLMEQPAAAQVRRILRVAPFLWGDTYRHHRQALAGLHWKTVAEDGEDREPSLSHRERYLWVVGGGAFRERVLARANDLEAACRLLGSRSIRELWGGRTLDTVSKAAMSPSDLVADGYWSAALARWRRTPPETALEELSFADCLHALGQFEEAFELARGRKGKSWSLIRLLCACELGKLQSASRELPTLLEREADWSSFTLDQRIQLLDTAIRVRANLDDWEAVKEWIQRALRWQGKAAAHAQIVAAGGYWDLHDLDAVKRHLETAVELEPEILEDWRFQRILGSLCLSTGDYLQMRVALEAALSLGRRSMRALEAGRCWSDVVIGRALTGDLAGAERACRHALRLIRRCDGPSKSTLVLFNFAEIRIRRGRFAGVRQSLRRTKEENALSGHRRGSVMDVALEGRFLTAIGELTEAEQVLRSCLDSLGDEDRGGAVRAEIEVQLARCLGWLGRSSASRAELERAGNWTGDGVQLSALPSGVLEPEEWPALLFLAGESDLALEAAHAHELSELWAPVCGGKQGWILSKDRWQAICGDWESYRAARVVFDLLLAGASVEEEVIEMAIDAFTKAGAPALARAVSGTLNESWQAAAEYLQWEAGTQDVAAADGLRHLFFAAGEPGVRIEMERDGETEVVLAGPGGEECIEVVDGECHWRFFVQRVDPRLRAMALLVVRPGGVNGTAERLPRPTTSSLPVGVVGASSGLRKAYRDLQRLAKSSMPLLILGETGTGKERAARAVHDASDRASNGFLPVNCAAVDQNLALSDLFGHKKGSFTGADRDREGVFEAAAGGTVFLDEIGDLSSGAQGLLLRVLQEGEVRRVGESISRPVDVRVVAATHRDLESQVRAGAFREDLLYRLNTGVVELPPLRERGSDKELLAQHFCREFGGDQQALDRTALDAVTSYDWPGNIRQLRNHVQRACALAGGATVKAEHLGLPEAAKAMSGWHEWLEGVKRDRLRLALERHDGNQSAAARELGLTRQALSYLVRQLGLA